MLYSYCTQNCIFLYFLEAKNPYFVTKNCSKSSYICVFILSRKQHSRFYKNLHSSGMVGSRKLSNPSLNRTFNVLSTGVHYTLSFQWTNFGRKCLIVRPCHIKKNVNKLKVSWRKFLTRKNPHSPNYAILAKAQYVLAPLPTIIRTISVTCNGHRLFSHFSCLKALRGTYLSSHGHMRTNFVYDYPCLLE